MAVARGRGSSYLPEWHPPQQSPLPCEPLEPCALLGQAASLARDLPRPVLDSTPPFPKAASTSHRPGWGRAS